MKESFEKQMEQLEEVVQILEKGELNLEESVSKFEEGMILAKNCNAMLETAEKKITILVNQDGNMKEEKFEEQ